MNEENVLAMGWHDGIGDAIDALENVSTVEEARACLQAMREGRGGLSALSYAKDLSEVVAIAHANWTDCGGHAEFWLSNDDYLRLQNAQAAVEAIFRTREERRLSRCVSANRAPRKVHDVKCISPYYDDVIRGDKPFEIRLNDRDYANGDALVLRHWDGAKYTGRYTHALITYMIEGAPYLPEGLCVLGIDPLPPDVDVAHAVMQGVPARFERILR